MFLFFCILFLAAPRLLQKNSTPATKEVKKGKAPRRDTHKHKPTILLPVSFSFPASLISCSSFAFPYRFRWFMRHTMQCRFFFSLFFCWGISLLMNSNIWCSEIAKQQWIVHTHTHTHELSWIYIIEQLVRLAALKSEPILTIRTEGTLGKRMMANSASLAS